MPSPITHSYYAVFINYPRRIDANGALVPACLEAVANPELTRRDVIDRINSGDYARDRIAFIHHIEGCLAQDVTADLMEAAEAQREAA